MSRAAALHFLEFVDERALDAPLMALLESQGYSRIHLTHGTGEFGKDIIAQREIAGVLYQYAIQSKSGDIGLSGWRDVRPQLVEAFENSLSHPDFNTKLPLVVVLVLTGRLKGNAPLEAQQFALKNAHQGTFEVWDVDQLVGPISEVLNVHASIDHSVRVLAKPSTGERELEKFTRSWLEISGTSGRSVVVLEYCVAVQLLAERSRIDLCALAAAALVRAATSWSTFDGQGALGVPIARMGRDAFISYVDDLITEFDFLDIDEVATAGLSVVPFVTAQAMLARIGELIATAVLIVESDGRDAGRQTRALVDLVAHHPILAQPCSDEFAISVFMIGRSVSRTDPDLAVSFLRESAQWLLDRHDPANEALGLASLDEPREMVAARLFGEGLTTVDLAPRHASFLATVLLDLALELEAFELFDGLLANIGALQINPVLTTANEDQARWRRSGASVWPEPNPLYDAKSRSRIHRGTQPSLDEGTAALIALMTRSRLY